jgi:hypothetical protein
MNFYEYASGKLGLICFAIYLVMLIRGRRTFSGTVVPSQNYWFVFIGMALYSVLGFLEWDTYNYYRAYEEMRSTGFQFFEPFYYWLTMHLPHSFLLWRFAIWGTACLLMIQSAKKLDLNSNVMCFMAPLLFFTQLTVTRGAIGLALMVFCAILFVQSLEKKKFLLVLVAILGIFASGFLHKSMIIFIGILVVSYFIPLNKRTFIVSLILFPFLYAASLQIFQNFSFFEQLNEDQAQLITHYQSTEKTEMNINGIIQTIFEKTVIVLLLFNMAKKYLYNKIESTKAQLYLFKFAYIMVYVSFLFLGQEVSSWVSNRTLHAASFALVLCATHCFDTDKVQNSRTPMEKVILVGLIIMTVWKQFSFMRSYW